MSYKPDNYHQTNPPCELKSVVLGRQASKKGQKQSDSQTVKRRSSVDWSAAHDACIDIYMNIHVSEMRGQPEMIKRAWSVGQELYLAKQNAQG